MRDGFVAFSSKLLIDFFPVEQLALRVASCGRLSIQGAWVKKTLRVRESLIEGHGLFASRSIKKGTLLGICKTVKTRKHNAHTLWTSRGPLDVVCRLRFINHSKAPNVTYYEDDLSVVALRDINPGEELTHDYGDEWR